MAKMRGEVFEEGIVLFELGVDK